MMKAAGFFNPRHIMNKCLRKASDGSLTIFGNYSDHALLEAA
jgi:hypothetical protein